MKKIYTLLTFLSFITISQTQTTLGMRVGTNLSNVNFSDNNDVINPKFKFGPTVGVFVNIPLNKDFSVNLSYYILHKVLEQKKHFI